MFGKKKEAAESVNVAFEEISTEDAAEETPAGEPEEEALEEAPEDARHGKRCMKPPKPSKVKHTFP